MARTVPQTRSGPGSVRAGRSRLPNCVTDGFHQYRSHIAFHLQTRQFVAARRMLSTRASTGAVRSVRADAPLLAVSHLSMYYPAVHLQSVSSTAVWFLQRSLERPRWVESRFVRLSLVAQ